MKISQQYTGSLTVSDPLTPPLFDFCKDEAFKDGRFEREFDRL
jgi:hypothetical protein